MWTYLYLALLCNICNFINLKMQFSIHILHSFAYWCVSMQYNVVAEAMYLSYERLLYTENAKNNW